MLWTWSVVTRFPFLVCMSRPPSDHLLMLRPPHLQTVMITFTFRALQRNLLWFHVIVMMRFLFRILCLLVPPPLPVPLLALALPHRFLAMPDALLCVLNICFFLFLMRSPPSDLPPITQTKRLRVVMKTFSFHTLYSALCLDTWILCPFFFHFPPPICWCSSMGNADFIRLVTRLLSFP
jgi:hypothetical protein